MFTILGGLADHELVTARLQSNCAAVFKFTHELAGFALLAWNTDPFECLKCYLAYKMCLRFSFQGRAKVSLKNNCEKQNFFENLGIFRDF